MGIKSDTNIDPYNDDFDPTKNFHRILFKPEYGVQARELTQMQTILQDQVERFGENILVEGTIVKGGNFTDINKLSYVKIRDNNVNNQPVNVKSYADARVVGVVSGVEAAMVTTAAGLESQSPNLNTLYVRYTKSGIDASGNDVKTFIAGETLNFYLNGTLVDELTVAVAPLTIDAAPLGIGYAVKCGDGIIFQKGHFVRFEDQITVVQKYDNYPDGIVVGFVTNEEIVNSFNDTSLLDNAGGYPNFNAPGADRLKLTPILTVMSKVEGEQDENFFAIQEYQEGRLIRRRTDTQFNSINQTLKKRTFEESGNYSIDGFNVSIKEGDDNKLKAMISAGTGYIEGERVEIISALSVDIDKATEFDSVSQQNVVMNYGHYIEVEAPYGSFASNSIYEIVLRSAAQTATSTTGFTAAGSAIGSAKVLSATKTSTGGVRLYVFAIAMNTGQTFGNVRSVTRGASAFGNLIQIGGALKDVSFKSLIFPLGRSAIKSVGTNEADYTYLSSISASATSAGVIQLSLSSADQFPYGSSATLNSDQRSKIYVTVNGDGSSRNVTSASTDSTGTSLTLNVGSFGASTPVTISVPVKRMNANPSGKDLLTVYVKIDANGNIGGNYSLGFPDVFQIIGIWKHTSLSFDENTAGIVNVTNNFSFENGQQENFYNYSMIKRKSGFTITNADKFLVKMKVFRKNTSGDFAQSYFSVNSYPVDDVTEILPANRIRTEEIPSFKTTSGSIMELRDSIDFRPQVSAQASYSTTASGASVVTSAAPMTSLLFSSSSMFLAGPGETLEVDYSYYLARKDRLMIDENGEFVCVKGVASESPSAPSRSQKGMVLATINIPPYPSLPSIVANRVKKPEYGVSLSLEDNRRYTMRDIGAIEKRIEQLEYYTVLNAIEKEAEDLVVTDENGLNRFKNGIFVDSFSNLMIADTSSDEFSASVDASESVLSPSFNQFSLDMIPVSYSNISNAKNEVLTLPFSQKLFAKVSAATTFRNCVTDFYNFTGKAQIHPQYDNAYDETTAPDINLDIDLATPFIEYTKAINKFVPLTNVDVKKTSKSSTAVASNTNVRNNAAGTTTTTTRVATTRTNTTTKTITESLKVGLGQKSTEKVGDFITDISFSPFLRANVVRIFVVGLRPNTRFWFFFDGQDVTQFVANGRMVGNDVKNASRTSNWGAEIRSNAAGEICAFFSIPAGRFYVGDRDLLIVDVNNMTALTAATSSATARYSGFNFSVEKTGMNLSTRQPSFSTSTKVNTTSRTSVKRTSSSVVVFEPAPPPAPEPTPPRVTVPVQRREPDWDRWSGGDNGGDPIAQTFMVEKNMSQDSVLFLSRLQVYFEKKSPNAGVTVQIRETDNGFPSSKIVPFGSVHLRSSQVAVSANASVVTNIDFTVPVTLETGKEYCFVIIPDGNNPDYRIWVAKTGQDDVISRKKITSDESTGTLFTSTNNRAWTPYQDENIKHNLFKCQFGPSEGYVIMAPDNYEFFELNAGSGKFRRGETVFVVNLNAAGTVTISNGSNMIQGVGTSFASLFAVGDSIAIQVSSNNYEVSKISEIISNTSMMLEETMKFNASGRNYFKTITGVADFSNPDDNRLHLKKSSAKNGNTFAAGQTVRGEITEAVGVISSVLNVPVSYVQNHYYRTNYMSTSTTLFYDRLNNGSTNINSGLIAASFDENDYFTVGGVKIVSRSNEINNHAGARTFRTRMNLANTKSFPDASPVFDYDISSVRCFEYIINNDSTNEETSSGNADARYVSKVVELADGLDAEDLNLWLTAYKPQGTDIIVYAKFKSAEDNEDISNIKWTRLDRFENTNFFSSSANRDDYREVRFKLPSSGTGAIRSSGGSFTYTAASGAIHSNFKFFAVKIVMLSTSPDRIPKVKDMRAIALT